MRLDQLAMLALAATGIQNVAAEGTRGAAERCVKGINQTFK